MENSNSNSVSTSSGVGSPTGGGTEGVDEAQDEEPSSLHRFAQVESELENFRKQWKREIELSPNNDKFNSTFNKKATDAEEIEEKAKCLFLHGIRAERLGKLQDAIALYRRAIQLVPDIEFKIAETMYDSGEAFNDSDEESDLEENSSDSSDEFDNLINKFQKLAANDGTTEICQNKLEQVMSHISCLPPEIFIYILKWVVSQDLDVVSLEQISKVCRGFYICARDPEIWRLICLRIWGVNVDPPNRYGSWRNMFIQKPHVLFNGVYISKTTYIRYGESSFQDSNYRPYYLVEYFRYLRFFPDGVVLMLTTPDDPYQSVYKLRLQKHKHINVMSGRYKLVGNTIMAVVKKPKVEISTSSNYYHHRRQRQANLQEAKEQTFHMELELNNYKRRINHQLSWTCYSIHMIYRNGEETVSNFDIVPSNFPPFWFSRVKSFTTESENLLI
ncbi:F-box only protein 9 [Parasteatoda tepidariorum]|uniref:F-box only protein 9 n=1 Tax=Parasteatoda tepidariorum TaxID=114398 RepID=UPI00077FB8C5|nr:F-box only protein 9 [Parasteatoda tepidariorum]